MRVHTRLTYFKNFECNLTVRVSGGDLCAAEAPIEPAGETKDASKFGAQSEGRDLISGSFIQPLIRCVFGKLFAKDIASRNSQENKERPQDEQEVIADIFRRMDEIKEDLAHERRQRKKLAARIDSK